MNGDGWLRGPQWATPAAREEWEDRLAAAAAAWEEIESGSVPAIREAALVFLSPGELARAAGDAAKSGLQLVPVAVGATSVRAAICAPALAGTFVRAWEKHDSNAIGLMLGFPPCCREAFVERWERAGRRDTTWDAFLAAGSADGPIGPNLLLRWLGVRLVPHLPCSFTCEATQAVADRMMALAREAGIEDVEQIEDLLQLPVTWSATAGAAEVNVGNVFRFFYETDPETVGTFSRGGIPAFGLEPPPWRDNGFASRAAMEHAHSVVAAVAGARRPQSGVDLGAGDGALLARIAAEAQGLGPWTAIEADEGRVVRGSRRRLKLQFLAMRIENPLLWLPHKRDVALLMPGRLLEMDPADRLRVIHNVRQMAARVVVYAYGDALPEGGLAQLVATAGLGGKLGPVLAAEGVQASEVTWQ